MKRIYLSGCLTLALISMVGLSARIAAQPVTCQGVAECYDPPDNGEPGDREDGGTRDPDCPEPTIPLTALVPITNSSLTADASPDFWLYVPYESGTLELRLKEVSESAIAPAEPIMFPVAGGSGIMHFKLPDTAPTLEAGKTYRWQFFFLFDSAVSCEPSISGVVERIAASPELEAELAGAQTAKERAIVYARYQLWHETVGELLGASENLTADWLELLQHPMVDLEHLGTEAIVPCCAVSSQP